MAIYVVVLGDTISSIASQYGVSESQLAEDNQLLYPYELVVGQALLVESEDDEQTDVPQSREIVSGGYAYPFISRWVLEQTLPFLTDLYIFSYGFSAEGDLLPPQVSADWMIEAASAEGVQSILTLTPFDETGNFNNLLIHDLITNEEAVNRLLTQLLELMQEKNYSGINIDFEFILAEDKDTFTSFVQQVANSMRAEGYETSVALAPKTSADQKGVVYEGKDYKALGEAADHVLLMTYEWGYTYGPPMAVAPLNQVRKVVEYALTEIPSSKIDLGIPNYGYDWPLPYEKGITAASTINHVQAVRIAAEYAAAISFDDEAASPYFSYWNEGVEHIVWFEDVRSLQAKFDLIKEYNLRGCGYWQIMQWFRANWLLLQSNFIITELL
jgi:spore germination protein